MKTPLVGFLSSLSRATLDPALGGKGLALSRMLSLATFALERGDEEAQALLEDLSARMNKALALGDLTHELWNDLQASAETGHWFMRVSFPQRGRDGAIVGGHVETVPVSETAAVLDLAKSLTLSAKELVGMAKESGAPSKG